MKMEIEWIFLFFLFALYGSLGVDIGHTYSIDDGGHQGLNLAGNLVGTHPI